MDILENRLDFFRVDVGIERGPQSGMQHSPILCKVDLFLKLSSSYPIEQRLKLIPQMSVLHQLRKKIQRLRINPFMSEIENEVLMLNKQFTVSFTVLKQFPQVNFAQILLMVIDQMLPGFRIRHKLLPQFIYKQPHKMQQQICDLKAAPASSVLKVVMPVLNPTYPQHYYQLFHAVKTKIQQQQYTDELNNMIEKLLVYGESNYTCWVAKKKILQCGNTTIQHQDSYSEEVLRDNLKNFQLWDYRNFVYEVTKDHEKEYAMMDEILEQSPKNYHLWSHRTRVVGSVGNYKEEIQRTLPHLLKDLYNNSAWTYRSFCFWRLPVKDYEAEIIFTIDKIHKNVDNEAAWSYLRGFFPCYRLQNPKLSTPTPNKLLSFDLYPIVQQTCKQIIENASISQSKKIQAILTNMIINSQKPQTLQYAREACDYLAEMQPLRANYYHWIRNAL